MPTLWISAQEKAAIEAAMHRARTNVSEQILIPIGYRAAISFEESQDGVFLHLSISVNQAGSRELPGPQAIRDIAYEFGIEFPTVGKVWTEEDETGRLAVNILVMWDPGND